MPATLLIKPWNDPIVDTLGHDPRSRYVETFWLPTLGPTRVTVEPMGRAAIYARISLDRTDESESPQRQEAECRALLAAKGHEVAEVFVDRDRSAFKKVERPEYDRLMRGVRERQFDVVCVFKLDRLTRRFTETGRILEALSDAGTTLLSVHDHMDTSTPLGQAMVGFLVAQAETESRNTSLRVRSASEAAARRGEPSIGGSRCFGYTSRMELIPEEAAVGREMADRVLAGESLRQIAFDLNRRGIRTAADNEWGAGRVAAWLRAARPAGLRVVGGEEITGSWERIVTPERRLEVMRVLAERGRAGGRKTNVAANLLVGFVYCGVCGGRLKTMGFRMKNGKPFPRYQCVKTPGQVNCGGVAASLGALDAHVTEEVLAFLARAELRPLPDERRADELAREVDADREALGDLTRERFVRRTIGPDEFELARAELQARLDQNEATLKAWERDMADREGALRPGDRDSLDAWWEAASLEDRRLALSHAVAEIKVNPARHRGGNRFDTSRVRIRWNWNLYLRAVDRFDETASDEERAAAVEEYERERVALRDEQLDAELAEYNRLRRQE